MSRLAGHRLEIINQSDLIECETRLRSLVRISYVLGYLVSHRCASLSTQQWYLSASFDKWDLGWGVRLGFWCEFLRLVTGAETRARAWLEVGCGCSLCFLWELGLRHPCGPVYQSRKGAGGEDGLWKWLGGHRARRADPGAHSSSALARAGDGWGLGWREACLGQAWISVPEEES